MSAGSPRGANGGRANDSDGLTRNEAAVLDALSRADAPMSAYAILDAVRDTGLKAPTQVYRALDKLRGRRLVHRLETLNAYIACCSGGHAHAESGARASAGAVVFVICSECGGVDELADEALDRLIAERTAARGFALESAIVELRGICAVCRAA